MLEEHYPETLAVLLSRLQSTVQIPAAWTGFWESQGVLPTRSDDRRQFARRRVREEAVCEMNQTLPAISRKHEFCKVCLKDQSRNGIAFLVMRELYPNEKLILWTRSGKFDYSVARCLKHNDRCYEIGARLLETECPRAGSA